MQMPLPIPSLQPRSFAGSVHQRTLCTTRKECGTLQCKSNRKNQNEINNSVNCLGGTIRLCKSSMTEPSN